MTPKKRAVHCTNIVNPLSVDKHCPFGNMTAVREYTFAFDHAGQNFIVLKPMLRCEACATQHAKNLFDRHCERGLFRQKREPLDPLTVCWSYLRKLRRKRKIGLARGILEVDEEYTALQVLYDIGVLTRDADNGWEVRDLSGTDTSHVSPSWYKKHKLYFVRQEDAIAYCQACLSAKQGYYQFVIRKGNREISQEVALSTKLSRTKPFVSVDKECEK